MDPIDHIRGHGGVAPRRELRCSDLRLARLIESGCLSRPRMGWYSTLRPDDPRYRAVAIGGRLTGVSALHIRGAWMLRPPSVLHVAVPRTASRLRTAGPGPAVVHWGPARDVSGSHALVGIRDALLRVAFDERLEVSVPCFDWALSTGRLDDFGFETILSALPRPARVLRDWVDHRSQSLLESTARIRLLQRGWSVRSQVRVGDLGAIDLVVEDQVAVELDGRKHHEFAFETDRRKDLAITTEGRHAIRVSTSMLYRDWACVEHAIEAALVARLGRGARSSGKPPAVPRGRKVSPGRGGRFA